VNLDAPLGSMGMTGILTLGVGVDGLFVQIGAVTAKFQLADKHLRKAVRRLLKLTAKLLIYFPYRLGSAPICTKIPSTPN
jgi:hypothetical protein